MASLGNTGHSNMKKWNAEEIREIKMPLKRFFVAVGAVFIAFRARAIFCGLLPLFSLLYLNDLQFRSPYEEGNSSDYYFNVSAQKQYAPRKTGPYVVRIQ